MVPREWAPGQSGAKPESRALRVNPNKNRTAAKPGGFEFVVDGDSSWRGDHAVEPQRSLGREALRFRRAVVKPLNSSGAAGAARSHRLPGEHVRAVLNVIDLTWHRRE